MRERWGQGRKFQARAGDPALVCLKTNLMTPARECDSVVPSTISSSPPTGRHERFGWLPRHIARKARQCISGSFTFNRGIGGEDHFSDFSSARRCSRRSSPISSGPMPSAVTDVPSTQNNDLKTAPSAHGVNVRRTLHHTDLTVFLTTGFEQMLQTSCSVKVRQSAQCRFPTSPG